MAVLGAVLAFGFSLLLPRQYSSSVRLLITQPNAGSVDPYTSIKATERIATSLQELVYSTSFYADTLDAAKEFDATYFPVDEYKKREKWRETIETSVAAGTGIMTVTTYHEDRLQARVLVVSAASEIAKLAQDYFGNGVRMQVIDAPLDSRWFARPQFVSITAYGALLGFFLGVGWVLWSVSKRG